MKESQAYPAGYGRATARLIQASPIQVLEDHEVVDVDMLRADIRWN